MPVYGKLAVFNRSVEKNPELNELTKVSRDMPLSSFLITLQAKIE